MLIVLYYVRPSSETSVLTTRKFCVDTYESSSTCKRRNDLVWRSVKHSVVVSTTLSGYTQGFHEKKKMASKNKTKADLWNGMVAGKEGEKPPSPIFFS